MDLYFIHKSELSRIRGTIWSSQATSGDYTLKRYTMSSEARTNLAVIKPLSIPDKVYFFLFQEAS